LSADDGLTPFDFVRVGRAVNVQLIGGRGHYEAVVQAAMAAEQSIWIATANLKELMVEAPAFGRKKRGYRSILEVFDGLVGKGVELRILHAGPPSRPFRAELRRWPRLRQALVMRACPRVHVKAVVIDGGLVYLGSANWTGAGLGAKGEGRRNFEVGILSRDDLLLDEIQAYYDGIWRGRPCGKCKLREECPGPLDGTLTGRRLNRQSAKVAKTDRKGSSSDPDRI
jgi:phosphatidylserine/phosphatidylglycerophosphate/cardiolipin synthase-like enzyme